MKLRLIDSCNSSSKAAWNLFKYCTGVALWESNCITTEILDLSVKDDMPVIHAVKNSCHSRTEGSWNLFESGRGVNNSPVTPERFSRESTSSETIS